MTYQTSALRPQAALLTLYGDYLLNRHAEIGIGSLITLLGQLGLSEQAVRSAVSRMCRGGLLKARRVGQKSYYSLDKDGHRLLTEGASRIFHRKNNHWDGSWNIVIYSVPEPKRKARDRLRLELNWMGYGTLSEATWISPYDLTKEVEELAERLKIKDCVQVFQAKNQGFSDAKKLVSQGWDLSRIHEQYARFIERYQPKLEDHQRRLKDGEAIEPSECFVERFRLIHEYRKLPFFDPDLPREILPTNWLRPKAAQLFQEYHALLADKANDYFDSVFKEY
jgi:phenylacetic acid degradation operon negative regulatory protein